MTSLYFEFLKVKEPKLYELCYKVEKYQNDDIDIVMLKCRKALEYIVTSLGCNGENLYEKVNDINNKLNIKKDIRNKIIALKNKCNESIHYNDAVDDVSSKDVINRLVEVCHWLIEAKIDKKVDTLINDNIEMLKKKQNELTEAFKKNDFVAVARISEEIKVLSEQQNKDIISIKSDNPSINQIDDGRYLSEEDKNAYYNKAISGDAEAQAKLAEIYYDCCGDYEDEEKVCIHKLMFYWSTKSAEHNNPEGLYMLGECYSSGFGCEDSAEKAFECYLKCAEFGDIDCIKEVAARYRLGEGCRKSEEKAFEYYIKSADLGDKASCRHVGHYYDNEFIGGKDNEKAFKYYLKGADLGDIDCIKEISNRYRIGRGCKVNTSKSKEYYLKYLELTGQILK